MNEGIDIPECDSVYITKPNDNIINLVQRMSRCNRILPNKFIANIFIWSTKSYIKKYVNDLFINKINKSQIRKVMI